MPDDELRGGWPELLERLDRHGISGQPSPDTASLAELMDVYRVPGISIAVSEQDGQIRAAEYGMAHLDTQTPVTGNTAFQACSISKHVAAFGALRLVGDGVLDLDADIHEYLTTWQLPANDGWRARVTPRQLLAHTAGLSYNWFRGYTVDEPVPSMVQTLAGAAPANTPPVRSSLLPGSRFRYSGSHYAVLQQVMVDVTGSRFEELMHDLVLAPVGMSDSSYDQQFPYRRTQLVASGHHSAGTPVRGGWRTIPEMAGAGLWSTPTDLVRFEREIGHAAAGRSHLLGRDLARQMLNPQVPGGFGLGTEVDERAGYRRYGHDGGSVGYTCFSYAWPDAGAVVAVMANSDDAREVLASIFAAAQRRYATHASSAAAAVPEMAGRYLLREDYPIDISLDDGRLVLRAADQPTAVLVPLPGGRYRHPGLDLEVTFHRTDDQPYTMELRQEKVTETATQPARPADSVP